MRRSGDEVRFGQGRRQKTTGTKAGKVREPNVSIDGPNRRLDQLTRELEEVLQQQTATNEVLSIIRKSPADAQPVFEAIVQSAARLCGAVFSVVYLSDDDGLRAAATKNFSAIATNHLRQVNRSYAGGRAVLNHTIVHVPDVLADPEYSHEFAVAGGWRAVLAVPLIYEGKSVGAITVGKAEPEAFSAQQVQLLQTFADQAVIAIENVRMFDEVQAKTRDLTEALVHQTGSSNILKVIASSPTDVEPALKAIVDSACEICNAFDAVLFLKDGDDLVFSAHHGSMPNPIDRWPINKNWVTGRAVIDKVPMQAGDLHGADGDVFPEALKIVPGQRHRTVLSVPLLREGEAVGALALRRMEAQPFNDRQIELLKSFADQAVIAISNVRLFEQVQQRTRELSKSLDDLRNAQDRLVQTEKLASLGQLTAGIAHEIKNPLNFVNNFSGMSAELIGELQDTLSSISIEPEARAEINELTDILRSNFEKVVQHGKRADAIVKSMLLHSGQSSGEHRPTNINALVEESLNRAYYGERAEKRGFSIKLEKSFDPAAGEVDLFPREISRALLNLISNGFYAAMERNAQANGDEHEPTLAATTKDLGDHVEIRIRDNGAGIPADVKEKMFDPFFTTKPSGEGTGLGLSISHDIIVKQHGGSIEVDTQLGKFAEIKVILPRSAAFLPKRP